MTYTFAIYIVIDLGQNPECAQEWEHCEKYIGTVPRSMFTLFQVITLSGWATNIVRPVAALNGFMPWVFILVMVLCSFGVLNVIVGVIVGDGILYLSFGADLPASLSLEVLQSCGVGDFGDQGDQNK